MNQQKQRLPADCVPSCCPNEPMWDKVTQSPNGHIVAAIWMSPAAKQKMYDMGWTDAVDGKDANYNNSHYMQGYEQGKKDLQ